MLLKVSHILTPFFENAFLIVIFHFSNIRFLQIWKNHPFKKKQKEAPKDFFFTEFIMQI